MTLVAYEELADIPVAQLVLNRPASRNALNGPLLDALDAALDRSERAGVRAVILTGAGGCFCAGADLKEELAEPLERSRRMHALALRLRDLSAISIAAIDGPALGGGLELAMACTFRVAGADARLGLPEIRMGLVPGFGGTQLLPRLVGPAVALDMLLSGEPVDAATARQIGLVGHVAAAGETLACARELAGRFVAHDPFAQQVARRAMWRGLPLPLEEGLAVEHAEVAQIAGRHRPADWKPPRAAGGNA